MVGDGSLKVCETERARAVVIYKILLISVLTL